MSTLEKAARPPKPAKRTSLGPIVQAQAKTTVKKAESRLARLAARKKLGRAKIKTASGIAFHVVRHPKAIGSVKIIPDRFGNLHAFDANDDLIPFNVVVGAAPRQHEAANKLRTLGAYALVAPLTEVHDAQREGVNAEWVRALSEGTRLPANDLFRYLGIPPTTAKRKLSRKEPLDTAGSIAVIDAMRLIGQARDLLPDVQMQDFDVEAWFGKWIMLPQPALGGKKPAELLSTPAGVELVSRVLGAIGSGAYL
ncbi:DUF2384 domain-containing protein [Solimonas sp. K1W22B-7]|uniref:antitoxin Xre/MbcA/ParS toxin-binding domain-containing protein n=1 Tax=Solimonas sp. K1W22B-7 TaxID=2303331 RepID=UPI000E33136E|nr:antitoxin Xre/MbcA/ParS toxin-binding domain-containing protein [Solimonas sp. K1W22B-7]AXQ27607.1 DUF2384 domain-containing protein [Solimonas sp. K1W22B-7]